MIDLRDPRPPAELAEALVRDAGRADTPFGLYVLSGRDPSAELARDVERDVFAEFFGNSPALLAEEYDPYEDASIFFVVIDHARMVPAGVMRVIRPSTAGLKSLDDLDRVWGASTDEVCARTGVSFAGTRVWDIATLAAAPEYRGEATGGLISLALYQAVGMLAARDAVDYLVAVLDLVVLDLIQTRIGRPFDRFRGIEPVAYLDSPASLPAYCDFPAHEARIRLLDPTMHALLYRGEGLEAAISSPDWDVALPGADRPAAASTARPAPLSVAG